MALTAYTKSVLIIDKKNYQRKPKKVTKKRCEHGRSQGKARGGGFCPPGRPRPAKNIMFLDYFWKNGIFFVAFQATSRFLPPPPLENFCPPLEKSLRTPMVVNQDSKCFQQLNVIRLQRYFLVTITEVVIIRLMWSKSDYNGGFI